MSNFTRQFLVLGCTVCLAACANLNTINRTTSLPNAGRAVHLDVQQRVLTVDEAGNICAEPSPDAMAAYAASLALGVSIPGMGAGSGAGGQQSSAANIGLRTQSITIMRDALYRVCEAFANDAIGPVEISTLLSRSQDLTAVILAVEQLTGVIAANQVALTGTTTAGASANLLANQEQLESAREAEAKSQQELTDAVALHGDAVTKVGEKETAKQERASELESLDPNADVAVLNSARDALRLSEDELNTAQRDLVSKEQNLDRRRQAHEESVQILQAIANAQSSALTTANAATTSNARFGNTPVQVNQLDKEATKEIADAVETMILRVLDKEYTEDSCMATITHMPPNLNELRQDQLTFLNRAREVCAQILLENLDQRRVTFFGADNASERIEAWLGSEDEQNRDTLRTWLDANGLSFTPTTLMFGDENAGARQRAIEDLDIP